MCSSKAGTSSTWTYAHVAKTLASVSPLSYSFQLTSSVLFAIPSFFLWAVPDYELVHLKKSKPRRSTTEEKEPLQYDFSAFGENYSLDLEHNDKLIAPGTFFISALLAPLRVCWWRKGNNSFVTFRPLESEV